MASNGIMFPYNFVKKKGKLVQKLNKRIHNTGSMIISYAYFSFLREGKLTNKYNFVLIKDKAAWCFNLSTTRILQFT